MLNLRYSYHLVINELLFSGNILREFYPEGALKSEAEIKEGKRHGRYREYYENGKLKFRGKYANNQPKVRGNIILKKVSLNVRRSTDREVCRIACK